MFYLTHFYIEDLPSSNRLRKLAYLTTMDTTGEIFLGTDNNPLDSDLVERMVKKEKIIPFIKKVELPENQSLYINKDGHLFLADRLDPDKNMSVIASYDPVLKKLFQE